MTYLIKRLIRPIICIIYILCNTTGANAQVSLIQDAIDKLESYKNFSYQFIDKRKDFTNDTTIDQNKEFFINTPSDKTFGRFFRLETVHKTEKFNRTDLYNGQDLVYINPDDSTYQMQKNNLNALNHTLIGNLTWIKKFLERNPTKMVKSNDTTVNGINNIHLIVNTYDTIINKEHYYTRKHLLIDKSSGIPDFIITISRNAQTGDGISNYYDELHYSDYKFNQKTINIALMSVPENFHPYKPLPASPHVLLKPGTMAPDWTLFAADGKKMSLSQMKGKVVLLDFYFIGCTGCMLSLKPLNNLHEKYKNQNFIIASITERDSRKSVLAFDKQYRIKYPGYVEAADVIKSYHITAFPTFYIIDKDGKIADVYEGYNDDLEKRTASILDALVKK